jgi:chitin synthase
MRYTGTLACSIGSLSPSQLTVPLVYGPAATCDPDEFTAANGWSLRTSEYGRETELLIAVTSCTYSLSSFDRSPAASGLPGSSYSPFPFRSDNEDKQLYSRTLHNIMLNVRDIVNNRSSKYWRKPTSPSGIETGGSSAWQKITVVLVADGMGPMDKEVLDVLATIGVYRSSCLRGSSQLSLALVQEAGS